MPEQPDERSDFLNDVRLEDLYFPKGHRSDEVNPEAVAKIVREKYRFLTVPDSHEMYRYEDGVYVADARPLVQEFCEALLGEKATNHLVNEILGHLERATFYDRSAALDGTQYVNVMNGIVDVTTGDWKAHSPDLVFFRQLPFAFDPKASCPLIDKFITEVFSPDDVELAYELMAYTLVPGYPIQKAFALVGGGSNGKSTFLNLIKAFLGPESVSSVSLQDLDGDRFASSSLYQKRANICADLPSRGLTRTSMFKALTGGDKVRAQFKHANAFSFENSAKLFFSMNQVPLTDDDSDAFFRRWVMIDFPNRFEGERLNLNKLAEITRPTELAGLFNRCLTMIPALLEHKTFCHAGSTEETRTKYQKLSDSALTFLEAQCVIKNGAWDIDRHPIEEPGQIRKATLYKAYAEWCMAQSTPAVKEGKFRKRLLEFNPAVSEVRINEGGQMVRAWRGIELRELTDVITDRTQRTLEGSL